MSPTTLFLSASLFVASLSFCPNSLANNSQQFVTLQDSATVSATNNATAGGIEVRPAITLLPSSSAYSLPINNSSNATSAGNSDSRSERLQMTNALLDAEQCDCDNFQGTELDYLKGKQIVASADPTDDKCLCLSQGNIVCTPKHAITIKLPEGVVRIAGGSIVLVMKSSNCFAVYDFHQTSASSVQVSAANSKKTVKLCPGELLVLAKQGSDNIGYLDNSILHNIAFRKPTIVNLDTQKAILADFSIPSAIPQIIPLRNMLTSRKSADRSKIDKLLTVSAMLMEASAYAGPYQTYSSQ